MSSSESCLNPTHPTGCKNVSFFFVCCLV